MGHGRKRARARVGACGWVTLALSLGACERSDFDSSISLESKEDAGGGATNGNGSSGGGESNDNGDDNGGDNAAVNDAGSSMSDAGSSTTGGGTTGGAANTTGGFMIPDFGNIGGDGGTPMLSSMAPKAAGDLVISEVMPDPEGGNDHEWIEIYNPGPTGFDLKGCLLKETKYANVHTIASNVFVSPGFYVVLARKDAGADGLVALYSSVDFSLSTTSEGDGVALECGSQLIDAMSYTTAATRGQSLQLSSSALTAAQNDVESAWCLGTGPIGISQNKGSPGAANLPCP